MHGALAIERTSDGTRVLFSHNVCCGGPFTDVGSLVQDRIISCSKEKLESTGGHVAIGFTRFRPAKMFQISNKNCLHSLDQPS